MGKRLINVDEVEEIVPVLVGKLLENNLITEEQANQIICDFSSSRGVFLFSDVDNYFKNHTVNVTINYPLKNPYTFTVKCIVLNDLINEIVLAYRRIYEEEKENPGKYGIWGHRIEDLWLEKATLDIETGNVKILVGS